MVLLSISAAFCGQLVKMLITLQPYRIFGIVSAGKHFSNTNLSDLSIVTYTFTECVTKSCDPPNWLIQTCYQSALSRAIETTFLTQKCFSVENLIIVS